MCFAPQRRALFRHRNFQKSSDTEVFCIFWLGIVLRATTACIFSTLQLPKVVRQWCALHILTWKCASRHNGVQFFISPLASWLRTRRFSEPTFRPSGATNHWKNTVNRDFPTLSRISIFFLLALSLLLFSLLIFLFSLPLPCSAFHLSILSEVWLLNFLRLDWFFSSSFSFSPDLSGRCRTSTTAPDLSGHCWTSTAAAISKSGPQPHALPHLNRELQISVGAAGPQPLSPNPGLVNLTHCRTSTASSRSQWALPDLNRERQISVGTAGPQLRALDRRTSTDWALPDLIRERGHYRTSTASPRSADLNRVGTAGPHPRAPDLSGHCRTSTASSRRQRALPDLNRGSETHLSRHFLLIRSRHFVCWLQS